MIEMPVVPLAPSALYFERSLAHEQEEGDADATLFVQLTKFELTLVQYGLWWIARLYGPHACSELLSKLHDLIKEQEFCDCPGCVAEREQEEKGE